MNTREISKERARAAHLMRRDGRSFEEIGAVLRVTLNQARTYAARGERLEREIVERAKGRLRQRGWLGSVARGWLDQVESGEGRMESEISTEKLPEIKIKKSESSE